MHGQHVLFTFLVGGRCFPGISVGEINAFLQTLFEGDAGELFELALKYLGFIEELKEVITAQAYTLTNLFFSCLIQFSACKIRFMYIARRPFSSFQ
jgi:hypothetical protein